ncbi:MAG: class I SAM-dependent methyltransferase [Acidobacteriota bacterium]
MPDTPPGTTELSASSTGDRVCPICDLPPVPADRIAELEVNHTNRRHLARQSYDLTYCPCGELIYLSPAPSPPDINSMYAESDQFRRDTPESPYRGEHGTAVLEYTTSRLASMVRYMGGDFSHRLRVLEVGAGLSWMCRAAKILDWEHLTVAQDLSDEAVQECRWVDHYYVEDVLEQCSVDTHGPFDVISMTHVFEHLVEPLAMLRRLAELLAAPGLIFVTAPHRPSGWQRSADVETWRTWSYNHTPAHLQYFSRGSFANAAEAAGLAVAFWDDSHEDGQAFEGWLQLIP